MEKNEAKRVKRAETLKKHLEELKVMKEKEAELVLQEQRRKEAKAKEASLKKQAAMERKREHERIKILEFKKEKYVDAYE